MPDTQWPRFMVFQQMAPGEPLKHNGTVHAPDIEMALLNGRDVFVRRPSAHAMWVTPVECIFAKTAQELADGTWLAGVEDTNGAEEKYHVFGKLHHLGQLEQLGMVQAASPAMAMKRAVEGFSGKTILVWWVFPTTRTLYSDEAEAESLFRFSESHDFKNQAFYPVITMMRKIRAKGKLED
jgi:ring-1,2-phenylacetyl-CoA epoxidase subunit PaaB